MIERRYSRRVLVKDFQLRFVLVNLLFLCLALAGFIVVLFGPLVFRLFDTSTPVEEQTGAATAFLALHARVWLGIALVLALSVVHLAIVSHRVAGPLVRLNRIFQAVRGGDVSMRVRVRQKDYLQEEAAALDRMTLALRRRLHAAKGRAARLGVDVAHLRAMIPPASGHDLNCALQSVEQQTKLLRQHLDCFRTAPAQDNSAPPGEVAPTR